MLVAAVVLAVVPMVMEVERLKRWNAGAVDAVAAVVADADAVFATACNVVDEYADKSWWCRVFAEYVPEVAPSFTTIIHLVTELGNVTVWGTIHKPSNSFSLYFWDNPRTPCNMSYIIYTYSTYFLRV